MKKNLKIVSLAAAALLAVSPVVASAAHVGAAINWSYNSSNTGTTSSSSNTTTAPTDRAYFTYNNQIIDAQSSTDPTANVVPAIISIKVGTSVSEISQAINNLGLKFFETNSSSGEAVEVRGTNNVENLFRGTGVEFKSGKVSKIPSADFNLTITGTGSNNRTAVVQLPVVVPGNENPSDADAPAFKYTENNGSAENLSGHVFQVTVNSNFDPTNFINSNGEQIHIFAQQTATNTTQAAISNTSNPVNTSEAGRFYNVTLTATGLNGKQSSVTYTVLITSSQKQTLYGNGTINTYRIYGGNVLSGSTTFKNGDQVYVSDHTRTINNVSYSQVSTKSKSDADNSGIWVRTADLTKPATTTPSETSETHRVMVDSRAYDKNGNYLGHIYSYNTNIDIVPTVVTINGKTYYKVAGKDEYVRVTNITGTPRTVRHNAYVYRSSYRRNWSGKIKYYRGETVHTYGAAFTFKNGKRYYRIDGCSPSNKRYIKAANF